MTVSLEGRSVTTALELLGLSELTGIRTYQAAGLRVYPDPARPEEAGQELQVMVQGDGNGVETRGKMVVTTPEADLIADIGAHYTFRETLAITQEAIAEFVEKVGVMAVFPFLRESVFTSASRLGVTAPVLGLLHAGDFHISPPDPGGVGDPAPDDIKST